MAEFNLEQIIKSGVEKALNKPIVDGKSITEWAAIGMKAPRWISVKDRLPDVKDNVLWYAVMNDGYGEIRISSFSGAINHDIPQVRGFGESFKPIYWMPLPEPPKEERVLKSEGGFEA